MTIVTKYEIGQKIYFIDCENMPNCGKIFIIKAHIVDNKKYISYKVKSTIKKEEYEIFEDKAFETEEQLEKYFKRYFWRL